jgi:hypothetical protein
VWRVDRLRAITVAGARGVTLRWDMGEPRLSIAQNLDGRGKKSFLMTCSISLGVLVVRRSSFRARAAATSLRSDPQAIGSQVVDGDHLDPYRRLSAVVATTLTLDERIG